MKLLQKVVVKQVLTEKSKNELQETYFSRIEQLQKECEQLQFERKKLEKTKKFSQENVIKQFEQEVQNRTEKIKLIKFQLDQLQMLPLGSEIKDREVEALIDVREGDSWSNIIKEKTIVIKDDKVIKIR